MTKDEFYNKQQSGNFTRESCPAEEKTVDSQDTIGILFLHKDIEIRKTAKRK